MDYSADFTAATGGDLGFVPESARDRPDPLLKKTVLAMRPDDITQPIGVKNGGYRILKLIAKEPAGQRELSDPQVQQSDPRHAAQPQGAAFAFGVYGRSARRFPCDQLSGPPNSGICRKASRLKISRNPQR